MAEKSLNELSRDLRMLFTKGNDALQRDNFDYAIDLYNQILAKEPGLYECRKVLRTAQARKAGTGGGFFKKMLSRAGSSPQVARGHMALSKDPGEALRIAEQILNGDPTNSGAHKLVRSEDAQQRRLVAAGCPGPHGVEQGPGRGPEDRRANPQWRSHQLGCAQTGGGSRHRPGVAKDGCHVTGDSGLQIGRAHV